MPSRLAISALLVTIAVPLSAQGRGGRGGPDNRPEVTFPVDLPVGRRQARRAEEGSDPSRRQHVDLLAADGRHGVQLRRARNAGRGDVEVPHRHPREERLQGHARLRRHSDRVVRDVGLGEAGHLARLGRRRHSAGESEAGRRLQGSDRRRRARTRRRTQLRRADEHHRGDRREEDHGARAHARARSTSGRASPKSRWRPRRTSSAPGMFKDVDVVLFAHVGTDLGVSYGQVGSERADQRAIQLPGLERARRRRAVGGP